MELNTTIRDFIKSNVPWVIAGVVGLCLLGLGEISGYSVREPLQITGGCLILLALVVLGAKILIVLYDHFLRAGIESRRAQREIRRFKLLLDEGIITAAEYEIKSDELKKKFL